MVLEYMTGGSLHDLLHNATDGVDIDTPLLTRMVVEVASGVAYLHANGVMHRDVKTANVLLDDARHAKVTDFGISTRFGRKDYTAETGTYRQMAPEVILHKPYNYKCDVYSYGVLLWEALHRQVPFTGFAPLQAAFAVAMEHQRPPINLREDLKVYQPLSECPPDPRLTQAPSRTCQDCRSPRLFPLFSQLRHAGTRSRPTGQTWTRWCELRPNARSRSRRGASTRGSNRRPARAPRARILAQPRHLAVCAA